ncbi:MAG: sugar ABC transporter substrate-binding protein [Limnochordales bacterium]|nr:sugar ABC transporter substrate-binding protein [Limnochordales bacterium]
MTRNMQFVTWLFVVIAFTLLPAVVESATSKTELTIGYYAMPGTHDTMESLVNRFRELHPELRVQTVWADYGMFYQKLLPQIAAGKGPDVWLSDGVRVAEAAEGGFALDITDWVNRDLDPREVLALQANRDPSGRIWGVPQGLQITMLFYNIDLFNSAGVVYPDSSWTLDTFRRAAIKLTRDTNGDGNIDVYGTQMPIYITETWFPIIKLFGGEVLDPTLRHARLTNPNTVKALRWMYDLIFKDRAATREYMYLASWKVAMEFAIYNKLLNIKRAKLNYGIEMLPQGPAGRWTSLVANSWVINKAAPRERQQAAWEWIKFFSGPEAQLTWGRLGEAFPANRLAVEKMVAEDPRLRAVLMSIPFAGTMDQNAVWTEWYVAVEKRLQEVWAQKAELEPTILLINQEVQAILDRAYRRN